MNNKFIEFLKEFHYEMRNIVKKEERDFDVWIEQMEIENWMKHCLAFYTLTLTLNK